MEATLLRLIRHLPRPVRARLGAERLIYLGQFLRFGAVGVAGFVVDTATVYALRAPAGLYVAGIGGFFTAATFNWMLNRIWTFRGHGTGPMHRQWLMFLAANAMGFVLNRGAYFLLIAFVPLCARMPVLAVAAGAVAGLFSNFTLSRALVFKPAPSVN